MFDVLIPYLNAFFMAAILAWATALSSEILIYRNIRTTFASVSELFHIQEKLILKEPFDYILAQGIYRDRRVVCRLTRLARSTFLHYTIGLHFYIEPLMKKARRGSSEKGTLTPNTQIEHDQKISYHYTATTSIRSLFVTARIAKEDLLMIFEELTLAAEIAESGI